ncbi:asparaginase domain-containing protein [Brevibacterium litoralis]|uniref:asparaginase domain-containing protein n=1 Tax=Brevibacterium litoralis TaxID=3138935 RepID=UPI0032F04855
MPTSTTPTRTSPPAGKPGLHVVALGGTIASTVTSTGGVAPQVSAEDIAAAARLDTLPDGAPQMTFRQIAQVSSGSIELDHLVAVVHEARRAAARGIDGLVLTQGTDTLEDSAFVLSLLNDSGIPVVVTGAMRNPTLPGADGPANVRAAALAALDPRLRPLPSLVVMADEIHDPTAVTKSHASSVATFGSGPSLGPLGWVSEDRVVLGHMPASLAQGFTVPAEGRQGQGSSTGDRAPAAGLRRGSVQGASGAGTDWPKVAHVEVGLHDSLDLLDALPGLGYRGVVLAGVGGGHVPAWTVEKVVELARRVPVVLASRTGSGATLERTYGYRGGEIELLDASLHSAGRLHPRKARLLLTLALHFGVPAEQAFAQFR